MPVLTPTAETNPCWRVCGNFDATVSYERALALERKGRILAEGPATGLAQPPLMDVLWNNIGPFLLLREKAAALISA